MTKKNALCYVLAHYTDMSDDVRHTLESMVAQLEKPRTVSPETAEKRKAANEIRKAQNAEKRATLIATVAPILRETITTDMTAAQIFEAAKDKLPEGFSTAKVQNILLREMAAELVKTETKNKPNTYRLK